MRGVRAGGVCRRGWAACEEELLLPGGGGGLLQGLWTWSCSGTGHMSFALPLAPPRSSPGKSLKEGGKKEKKKGGREQWAMSGAVRRGPGLAGGGRMASGGHNPGRQARDDRDDCKSSQEHETVSRVTVGKAPLSFHIREVVKSVVRPGPDSVLHRRGSRPRLQRAGVHVLTNASGHPLHLPTILPHGTL